MVRSSPGSVHAGEELLFSSYPFVEHALLMFMLFMLLLKERERERIIRTRERDDEDDSDKDERRVKAPKTRRTTRENDNKTTHVRFFLVSRHDDSLSDLFSV